MYIYTYICMYLYKGPDYGLGKVGKCLGPMKVRGCTEVRIFF